MKAKLFQVERKHRILLFLFSLFLVISVSYCGANIYKTGDVCAGDGRVECSVPSTTSPDSYQQKAVDWAVAQTGRGLPYAWAEPSREWERTDPFTNPPWGFDCSGLVGWAWYWGSSGKVYMYGQTGTDFGSNKDKRGNPYYKFYDRSQLKIGDLIYFYSPIHHVGMYIGSINGVQWMVHSRTGGPQMATVDSWSKYITGYLRPTWK